jgi:hypothetical protein
MAGRLAAVAIDPRPAADATRKEKAVIAGKLLAEAQKRHPTKKAFEKFLQMAGGIGIRRARDLIALAQGRKDFEKHQADNAAAQQRHRDRLRAERIERERERSALPKPDPKPKPQGKPEPDPALRNADGNLSAEELRLLTELQREERLASAAALQEFKNACQRFLPKMSADDLGMAFVYMDTYRRSPNKGKTNKEAA